MKDYASTFATIESFFGSAASQCDGVTGMAETTGFSLVT